MTTVIPVDQVAKWLKTHRKTLTRTVRESHKDPRSPLKNNVHYRLTKEGRVKILDAEGFASAYRLYLAYRDLPVGISLTNFCKLQKLNAQTVKALIEQKQAELESSQIVTRHYRGWRILKPSVFLENILNDCLRPVDFSTDNDPQSPNPNRTTTAG